VALFLAMGGLLLSEEIPAPAPDDQLLRAAPRPIAYSVRAKSGEILGLLRERRSVPMRELIGMCSSRSEMVAAFLSILELCFGGEIRISGAEGRYRVEYEGGGESREADDIWN
jgi:chromatin segregation and condensation protein Rec8/ScpA/Scc1 (kleisin family)